MGWTICGDTPRTRSVPIIKTPRSIIWSIVLSDTSKAFPQRKHDARPAYYPMTSGSKKNVKCSLVTCLDKVSDGPMAPESSAILASHVLVPLAEIEEDFEQ